MIATTTPELQQIAQRRNKGVQQIVAKIFSEGQNDEAEAGSS